MMIEAAERIKSQIIDTEYGFIQGLMTRMQAFFTHFLRRIGRLRTCSIQLSIREIKNHSLC